MFFRNNMNDLKTSFFIAYKSIIKGSKSTSILMIFILSLTFLNMMFISGVLTGLEQSEVNALRNFFSSDIIISPQQVPQPKQFIPNQSQVRAQVEAIPGVSATAGHYLLAASLSFDKNKNGQVKSVSGPIIGINPAKEKKVLAFDSILIQGTGLSEGDTDQIILSSALAGGFGVPTANDLGGVKIGDKVNITYSNGVLRNYRVKGNYTDILSIVETFISSQNDE